VNSCRALRSICADCPAVPMGCTDPTAVNYNCALVDDGSCIAADPGNDCLTAIPIVPDGPTATCTVNSVNFLATNFSGTIPSCEFSTVLNDKWYSWNSGMINSLNFSAYDYGVHVAVYRNSCGSLTEVDCLGSSTGQLSGWTTNESLYIQVYNTYSYNSSSTFCLQENCDPLVEMTYTCTSDSTFDIVMDVLSMGGATSYGLSIADFSTVFITDTITSSGTYTYSNFPAGTGYTTDLIGLDVGACTYSSFYYANCFCFGAEPINDLCLDAVMLPVYPDSCIASTMGTIQCAIQYENDVSACNYYGYYYGNTSDVWYTFTAPASGSVTMDLLNLYGGTYYGFHLHLRLRKVNNMVISQFVCGILIHYHVYLH